MHQNMSYLHSICKGLRVLLIDEPKPIHESNANTQTWGAFLISIHIVVQDFRVFVLGGVLVLASIYLNGPNFHELRRRLTHPHRSSTVICGSHVRGSDMNLHVIFYGVSHLILTRPIQVREY